MLSKPYRAAVNTLLLILIFFMSIVVIFCIGYLIFDVIMLLFATLV